MRIRRIAILVDGGFSLKRLPKLVEPQFCSTPKQVAESARHLCKRHAQRLAHISPDDDADGRWLDHVYRPFYYDAVPYDGVSHHPILNQRIEFAKAPVAAFRQQLFSELRRKRKFALRLGHVNKESDWQIVPSLTKPLLRTRSWVDQIKRAFLHGDPVPAIGAANSRQLRDLLAAWRDIDERKVKFGLRQKGVDMRIGLDIASITLKRQADTIVLITGDSDFVPAAKLVRREGIEFVLDPLWQKVNDDLNEHADGVVSVFPKPAGVVNAPPGQ